MLMQGFGNIVNTAAIVDLSKSLLAEDGLLRIRFSVLCPKSLRLGLQNQSDY
jgi:hypothetical protein